MKTLLVEVQIWFVKFRVYIEHGADNPAKKEKSEPKKAPPKK